MPIPIHHHLSASIASLFFIRTSLFKGSVNSSKPSRPRFAFPVDCVGVSVDELVGFNVWVGSICGGLYARYMGFKGEPSNAKRLRRKALLYSSVKT